MNDEILKEIQNTYLIMINKNNIYVDNDYIIILINAYELLIINKNYHNKISKINILKCPKYFDIDFDFFEMDYIDKESKLIYIKYMLYNRNTLQDFVYDVMEIKEIMEYYLSIK